MRTTRAAGVLTLALALVLFGCRDDEKKGDGRKTEKKAKVKKQKQGEDDKPEIGAEAPPRSVGAEHPSRSIGAEAPPADSGDEGAVVAPILLESEALAMIPGSAIMVAAVAGVEPLAERLGWDELRTVKRDWYEMAVAAVVQFVGHNLLDFANLTEIGVDPEAPVGFAWLSWEDETVAGWVRLTDSEKFKLTLYKLAGLIKEELRPETMGEALILSFKREDEAKIVLRGDFAFLVISDDGEEEAMAHARRVASIDRPGSMLEVERFKSLMAALDAGRDAALYIDMAAVIDDALGEAGRHRGPEPTKSWAETELKEAKTRGADREELDRLTKQLEDERRWQETWRRRREAEADLVRTLWGSLGAVACGAEIGEASVFSHSVATVGGGTVIELFGRSDGRPLITRVVSGKPWMLAGATVDVATYTTLMRKLLRADGTDWAEVEEEAREHLGLDLARDVLTLLDGQAGIYMGGKIRPRAEPPESFRELEGGGYLGVNDAAKATALLEKLAGHSEIATLVKRGGGGWEVQVPDWRTVYVRVADGYLAAATDTAFIDRVAEGGGGDWPGSMGNEDLEALFTGSDANAAWMMDMGFFGYLTFARFSMGMEMGAEAAAGPDEAPFSPEWKDKEKEIKDLEADVEAARKRLEEQELEVLRAMFGAFGVTAAVGGPGPGGLEVRGGQYFGQESIPAVAREMANRAFEMEALSSRRDTEIWQRRDKVWRLREELREIRRKDVEEHLKNKAADEGKDAAEDAAQAGEKKPSTSVRLF